MYLEYAFKNHESFLEITSVNFLLISHLDFRIYEMVENFKPHLFCLFLSTSSAFLFPREDGKNVKGYSVAL